MDKTVTVSFTALQINSPMGRYFASNNKSQPHRATAYSQSDDFSVRSQILRTF